MLLTSLLQFVRDVPGMSTVAGVPSVLTTLLLLTCPLCIPEPLMLLWTLLLLMILLPFASCRVLLAVAELFAVYGFPVVDVLSETGVSTGLSFLLCCCRSYCCRYSYCYRRHLEFMLVSDSVVSVAPFWSLLFPASLLLLASLAVVVVSAVSLSLLLLSYLLLLTLLMFHIISAEPGKYIDVQFCSVDKEHFCKKIHFLADFRSVLFRSDLRN